MFIGAIQACFITSWNIVNSYSTKQKNYDPEYRSQRLIYFDTYFLCLQFQNTGSLTTFCIDTKVYSPSLLPYKNYYSILLYRQLFLADLVNQCLPKKRKWQEILTISQSQKYKFLNKELLPNLHLLLSFLSDRAFPWFPGKINEYMSETHYPLPASYGQSDWAWWPQRCKRECSCLMQNHASRKEHNPPLFSRNNLAVADIKIYNTENWRSAFHRRSRLLDFWIHLLYYAKSRKGLLLFDVLCRLRLR